MVHVIHNMCASSMINSLSYLSKRNQYPAIVFLASDIFVFFFLGRGPSVGRYCLCKILLRVVLMSIVFVSLAQVNGNMDNLQRTRIYFEHDCPRVKTFRGYMLSLVEEMLNF
jgi:hypothetical protein